MLFTPNPLADDDDDLGVETEDFSLLELPIDLFADYDESVEEDEYNSLVVKEKELENELQETEDRKTEEENIGMHKVRTHRISLAEKKDIFLRLISEERETNRDKRNDLFPKEWEQYEQSLASAFHTLCKASSSMNTNLERSSRQHSEHGIYVPHTLEAKSVGSTSFSYDHSHGGEQYPISGTIQRCVASSGSKLEHDSQRVCELISLSSSLAFFQPEIMMMTQLLHNLSTCISNAMSSSLSLLTEVTELEIQCRKQLKRHTQMISDTADIDCLLDIEGRDSNSVYLENSIRLNKRYQNVLNFTTAEVSNLFDAGQMNAKSGTVLNKNSFFDSLVGHIVDLVSLRTRRDDLITESRRLGGLVLRLRAEIKASVTPLQLSSKNFNADETNDAELQGWLLHLISRSLFMEKKLKSTIPLGAQKEKQKMMMMMKNDADVFRDDEHSNPFLLNEINLLQSFLSIQDGCLHAVAILHENFRQYAYNAHLLLCLASIESQVDPILAANVLEMEPLHLDSIENDTMFYLNLGDIVEQLRNGCSECYNIAVVLASREENHWIDVRTDIEKMLQANPFLSKCLKRNGSKVSHCLSLLSSDKGQRDSTESKDTTNIRFCIFSPQEADQVMVEEEEHETHCNLDDFIRISVESMENQQAEAEKRMKFFDQQPCASLLNELRELQGKNADLHRMVVDEISHLKKDVMEEIDRKDRIELKQLEESWAMIQYELGHLTND